MNQSAQARSIAGWYGKLPSLGDFASRRLPPEFIEGWDQWLARGLADWQAHEPDWLTHYLQGPSWRFLIGPGLIGAATWIGVLMPSVDQVGRYFPLCLATARRQLPDTAEQLQVVLDWLLRLDDLALDAMQYDWPIDTLEAELDRLGECPDGLADAATPLAQQVAELLSSSTSASVTFWICRDELGEPFVYQHPGLPGTELVSALLAGRVSNRFTTDEDLT
jgi:type VI secretion system protein ImpM